MNVYRDPADGDEVRKLIEALFDGTIDDEGFGRLDHWIGTDSGARQLYLDYLQIHQDLPDLIQRDGKAAELGLDRDASSRPPADCGASRQGPAWRSMVTALITVAALVPFALFVGIYVGDSSSSRRGGQANEQAAVEGPSAETLSEARFASFAHAKFFGELPPQIGAAPILQRDYVMIQGMVELRFPNGATAVIQGPASFRVEDSELLALDIGKCSVHAPPGAEGFRVETPQIRVVDRGTRFSVNVSQESETDVQVVEGAADVYLKPVPEHVPNQAASSPLRLREKQAMRFAASNVGITADIPSEAALTPHLWGTVQWTIK